MSNRATLRTLRSILAKAERLRPQYEQDEQMHQLVGGIIVNAEDAIGALEAEARWNALEIIHSLGCRRCTEEAEHARDARTS